MNGTIKKIKFDVGSMYGYDKFIITVNQDDTSTFFHEAVNGSSMYPNNFTYSIVETKKFLSDFEQSGIYKWKKNYSMDDIIICDGTHWKVEIERTGLKRFIREGDNIFPAGWNAFCRLFGIGVNKIKLFSLSLCSNPVKVDIMEDTPMSDIIISGFNEALTIDVEKALLTHVLCIGTGYTVKKELSFYDDIDRELDDICMESILESIEFCLDEGEWVNSNEFDGTARTPFFNMEVIRYDGSVITHKGLYNKNHLPKEWKDVIKGILTFLRFYGDGNIFDVHSFNNAKGKMDLTFYSVEIGEFYDTYYYFSKDETLGIGDSVLVPFGRNDEIRHGIIDSIDYFAPDDLPFPIEKMKYIIGRNGEL